MSRKDLYKKIYHAVSLIPSGRVATYGQIAEQAGIGRHARVVGYALHNLPGDSSVPWYRVVNARGMISLRESAALQRILLEREGVPFNSAGRINLSIYRWDE